jgi:hypothetical protein
MRKTGFITWKKPPINSLKAIYETAFSVHQQVSRNLTKKNSQDYPPTAGRFSDITPFRRSALIIFFEAP